MVAQWLGTTWSQVGLVALSTIGIYVAVIIVTRVHGLRTFSKMSSFDFAATVAVGSIMASIAVTNASLVNGAVALVVMHLAQKLIASNRFRSSVRDLVDNRPVLLMLDGEFLDDALDAVDITRHDVIAKLRENGVTTIANVATVVAETTGDISVLHGAEGRPHVDPGLYDNVVGAEHLTRGFDGGAP